MRTVSESFAESSPGSPVVHVPPVVTRSSSTGSEDSSSDLMEHFLSELDLVFSDILAEEVSHWRHFASFLQLLIAIRSEH